MRFIGDVHGKWYEYLNILQNPKDPCSDSIQVGDFGLGFGQREKYVEYVTSEMTKENHRHQFIRGNHDSPEACKNHPNWIPDGRVENDVMYLGGAWSIDQHRRTEGVSWWRDEECSLEFLDIYLGTYDLVRPKIMVTHDGPRSITKNVFLDRNLGMFGNKEYPTRTGQVLQAMLEIHQPELWIFGHWHHDIDEVIDGTRFICLGELSYIDIDLDDTKSGTSVTRYIPEGEKGFDPVHW